MNVLVINAGSSSIKYQLIDTEGGAVKAKGLVERIGLDGSNLLQKSPEKGELKIERPMGDHVDGMKILAQALTDPEKGVLSDMSGVGAVGHRVVHGGEKFASSVIIDEGVMAAIKENVPLAPLHNPANIQGIEACRKLMPGVSQVAVFDTAFHQAMPDYAYMYGVPYELYEKYRLRRYGFHGTSHRFVAGRAAQIMGRDISGLNIITCHLGNGSSIAAVKGGKSVDTSMGLTPLEGLLMGTRSGNLDPAIIDFISTQAGMSVAAVNDMLNKKSGLLGVSGVSSDMRDVQGAMENGNRRARLAIELLCYGVKKYIGAYSAAMGGVHCVAFAGGIGENNSIVREKSLEGLDFMGIKLDKAQNIAGNFNEGMISMPDSPVKVYIIQTNEELAIANDTLALVGK